MDDCGALRDCRYLLHDRDTKFTRSFRAILASGQVEPLELPACSPNLNAHAERWVRSVKEECLSKVILFGERSLRRVLSNYVDHFHTERNYQGKGNVLLFELRTAAARGQCGAASDWAPMIEDLMAVRGAEHEVYAAAVNGKVVPLSTRLSSDDRVFLFDHFQGG